MSGRVPVCPVVLAVGDDLRETVVGRDLVRLRNARLTMDRVEGLLLVSVFFEKSRLRSDTNCLVVQVEILLEGLGAVGG